MKLLAEFKKQVDELGPLKRVWMTSFNLSVDFVESHLLPAVLELDLPKKRMDYEIFQRELAERKIDFKVLCDKRMMSGLDTKRTAIDVFGVSTRSLDGFSEYSLFHPKVIYLEDVDGKAVLGAGSANLTISGWGRNQEVFAFRKIATEDQYQQVQEFFSALFPEENLSFENTYWGEDKSWQFKHSFQKQGLFDQLIKQGDTALAVWSPYFPKDLAGFINRLKPKVSEKEFIFHITPDRIEGQFVRTQWSDGIVDLAKNGDLQFYDGAIKRHDNTELCHAKVWKTASRLAIGSWNFTGPGSNQMLTDNGEFSSMNNIEAGFIFEHSVSIEKVLGGSFDITAEVFASTEKLEKEALHVPDELPFDLQVMFDWQSQRFSFEGVWRAPHAGREYKLKLPDYGELQVPCEDVGESLNLPTLSIQETKDLLNQHSFDVLLKKDVVYRGMIIETNPMHRRVQAYENLNDLLDSLISQADPELSDNSAIRDVLKGDAELYDEVEDLVATTNVATSSYFRLFKATDNFEQKLRQVDSLDALEKSVFVHPGCLLELAEKIRQRTDNAEADIFNWFLTEEYQQLATVAIDKYKQLLGKKMSAEPLAKKWTQLDVKAVALPADILDNPEYVELIKKECDYV